MVFPYTTALFISLILLGSPGVRAQSISPGAQRTAAAPAEESAERDSLTQRYLLPTTLSEIDLVPILVSLPGLAIGSPTAFGAAWRDVFAGVGYQDRIRFADARDGALTTGFGLGDPRRFVALEVTFTIWDTATDFFDDRSLSLMVHRILPYDIGLGVGVENLLTTSGTDGGTSKFIVATRVIRLRNTLNAPLGILTTSIGVGDGRFLPEHRFRYGDTKGLNVFGSVGLRLIRGVGLVGDWTGQDLNIGLSLAPFQNIPLVITPALADVTGSAGDGVRFVVAMGYAFRF